jgi:shikimate dehydrogenase
MTDGNTQLVGLIGWPVEHSFSPAMHNAAFEAMGLNWHYVPLPVPPGQVEIAVRGLGALGFRGANVTVPHKQAVIEATDSIAPNAKGLGAVNTLVVKRDATKIATIHGHNTDVDGLVGALRENRLEPQNVKSAVVVGAGGAARAAICGLLDAGVGHILVLNRTPERAETLVADLTQRPEQAARLSALALTQETLIESCRQANLLVNATAVGMWPRVNASIWPDGVAIPSHLAVFDLVYNPVETQLLQQARQSGAKTIDGLGMLILQGALAFEMWTGQGPVSDIVRIMRAACERAIRDREGRRPVDKSGKV